MNTQENFIYSNFESSTDSIDAVYNALTSISSIYSAISLNIFEYISSSNSYKTIPEIKENCNLKCNERNLLDLLDILYFNSHLLRENIGLNAKYYIANELYVKSNPNNLIFLVEIENDLAFYHMKSFEINLFSNLSNLYEEFLSFENFENAMKSFNYFQGEAYELIIKTIDLASYKSFLSIGISLNNLCLRIKKSHDLKFYLIDSNKLANLSKTYFSKYNLEVEIFDGNYLDLLLPTVDFIIIGNELNNYSETQLKELFCKTFKSLNKGGMMLIVKSALMDGNSEYHKFDIYNQFFKGTYLSTDDIKNFGNEAGFTKIIIVDNKVNYILLIV